MRTLRPLMAAILVAVISLPVATTIFAGDEDPYLWLEEVEGEKALEWV